MREKSNPNMFQTGYGREAEYRYLSQDSTWRRTKLSLNIETLNDLIGTFYSFQLYNSRKYKNSVKIFVNDMSKATDLFTLLKQLVPFSDTPTITERGSNYIMVKLGSNDPNAIFSWFLNKLHASPFELYEPTKAKNSNDVHVEFKNVQEETGDNNSFYNKTSYSSQEESAGDGVDQKGEEKGAGISLMWWIVGAVAVIAIIYFLNRRG